MMKYLRCLVIILGMLLLLSACSKNKHYSKLSENLYKKGDYHAATLMAIESLRLKPNNARAQQTLRDAYPLALQEHNHEIDELKAQKKEANWPQILKTYQSLDKLSSMLRSLPQLTDPDTGEQIRFDIYNYQQEIDAAIKGSAEYHYKEAIHLSRMSADRATQKKAALAFKQAWVYVPGYKDSELLYEEARKKAILRIAILDFEDKSGSRGRYGALSDILMEQIISAMFQDKNANEFVEIITRDQIDKVLLEQQLSASGMIDESSSAKIGMLLGAHEIMSGKILQIDYSAPRTVSVDLVEKAEISVDKEDGEAEEKLQVQCSYSRFIKKSSLKAVASYSVVDVSTAKILHQRSFNAEKSFSGEWGKFLEGDRRALSSSSEALISKAEPLAPTDKELANRAITDLAESIVIDFRSYLK